MEVSVNILDAAINVHKLYDEVSKSGAGTVSLFVGNKKEIFEKSVLGTVTGASRNDVIKSFLIEVYGEVRKKYNFHNIVINCWLDANLEEPCLAIACLASDYQHATEAVNAAVDLINGSKSKLDCDDPTVDMVPVDMIQVKASCAEINQRIHSFIERRREQLNVDNIRDFCSVKQLSDETSCARVDAVKIHRKDSRSHLRVRKVFNSWGPQTVHTAHHKTENIFSDVSSIKQENSDARNSLVNSETKDSNSFGNARDSNKFVFEERIRNMEDHIGLSEKCSSTDIHSRLKKIEDKILYLEGLSPEYFEFWETNTRKLSRLSNVSNVKRSYSATDISKKIKALECKIHRGE